MRIRELRSTTWALWVCVGVGLVGCKEDEPPPEEPEELGQGDPCDPNAEPGEPTDPTGGETDGDNGPATCAPGLSCEPVDGTDDHVCGTAVEIHGLVTDSANGEPIEGALVAALNESGEPVTDVAITDSCGGYVLPVTVRRTPDGEFAETPKWTLFVTAQDFLPFPQGIRPALPIDIADAMPDPDGPATTSGGGTDTDTGGETYTNDVIDNAATSVALIHLPANEAVGSVVTGSVAGEGVAGMLVVAEDAGGRVPYGIVDASGHYTLFNVPDGLATIRGYRRGVEVEPQSVMTSGMAVEGVDLPVLTTNVDDLATVNGSLNIVNAPGGSQTSVVLVPTSLYNDVLERGPVPVGLRVPDPPLAPNVTGEFGFVGVPSGAYKVLVAFENDFLVRDPDEGIAGTAILEINLAPGEDLALQDSFKVTEALAVVGPGVDAPESIPDPMPTLSWADDSSEDGYELRVFDALGTLAWETEVPGVSGSDNVDVPYAGDPLLPGMYYQFRATSYRDQPGGTRLYISRTEDLRGVFVYGEAEPVEDCDPEESGADSTGGDTTGG